MMGEKEAGGSSKTSANADEDAAQSNIAGIGHVAVKPPAFEENSVSKWFKILESMSYTVRISISATKFHHALSHLPLNVVTRSDNDIIDEKDYNKLKSTLISMFSKSTPELFDSLIDQNEICFSKPTIYLHELRKLGQQLNLNDDFLKIKFLKGLPDNIRPIIVAKENMTLDEMACAADCIMDYEAGKGNSVFSVNGPPRVNYGDVSFSNSWQPVNN